MTPWRNGVPVDEEYERLRAENIYAWRSEVRRRSPQRVNTDFNQMARTPRESGKEWWVG